MTNEQKSRYEKPLQLRDILRQVLEDRRFMLDCGHAVLFKRTENDITVVSGWEFKIACRWCCK